MSDRPITSPYRVPLPDNFGKVFTISFVFDEVTRALTSANVTRDAGCQWGLVLVGIGPDGTPDTTAHLFNLRGFNGTRTYTSGQLSGIGLNTIEDVLSQQITASP